MDLRELIIERAPDSDFETLTGIAFAAKRHWNYPDKYFEMWKEERNKRQTGLIPKIREVP